MAKIVFEKGGNKLNLVNILTLCISLGTFIILIINSIKNRKINVLLSEKRKMQNDLFLSITKILDIGRRSLEIKDLKERQQMKYDLLNHKILIWINLDYKNKYAKDMRENCNQYIFWCASSLENNSSSEKIDIHLTANKNLHSIWQLIDLYIEEENKLIEKLI